jgi:hypothetical protein
MKIIIIAIIFFAFTAQNAWSQNVSETQAKEIRLRLKSVDIKKFEGKLVQDFLKENIVNEYISYFFSQEPPLKLSYLVLVYAKRTYVYIYPKELVYQDKFNPSRNWYFEKFRWETIRKIEIFFD